MATTKIKVGDRVAVYGGISGINCSDMDSRNVGTVLEVFGTIYVRFDREIDGDDEWYVEPNQCRRLVKKARK